MRLKTLIFLKPFTKKNPTLAEQNAFMMHEIVNEVECADMGLIYNNDKLYGKDLYKFIIKEVERISPEWVVAEGECATVAITLKGKKKVLINPKVAFDNLNDVPGDTRLNTFGFFDNRHVQDYERFLPLYPHAALFTQDDDLSLFTIKRAVQSLIKKGEW